MGRSGKIVSDGIVRVDDIVRDHLDALDVLPPQGHDVAAPVGRVRGVQARVDDDGELR